LKEKSQVKDALRIFLKHANQQGHDIKECLSDNGGEFDCADVKNMLQKEGISIRLTARHTHQSRTARLNETIALWWKWQEVSSTEIRMSRISPSYLGGICQRSGVHSQSVG